MKRCAVWCRRIVSCGDWTPLLSGPALAGEVSIDAEVLRVGKAVTIARASLWSDGKIAATLTGIYGAARTTALSLAPTVAAGVPAVEDLPESPTRSPWAAHPSCSILATAGPKGTSFRRLEPAHREDLCSSQGPGAHSPNPTWWR